MKIGSLCSGYGGLDLAVEALTGAETLWHSEFDKHANKVYESHWSNPNLGDLTQIDWETVPKVDILTGGYPCQPFSNANKNRKGTNDKRHIFPYIANAIRILRPRFVFFENVRGHLSLGFDSVLRELTQIGYDTKWSCVKVSDIGGCHNRERLFIIAEPTDSMQSRPQRNQWLEGQHMGSSSFANTGLFDGFESLRNQFYEQPKIDSGSNWRYQPAVDRWARLTRPAPPPVIDNRLSPKFVEWMMGLPEGWVTETGVSVSQQLKILGNGVVPQQAYYAYKTLLGVQ